MATQVGSRVHRTSARRLHFEQLQRAGSADEQQAAGVRRHAYARLVQAGRGALLRSSAVDRLDLRDARAVDAEQRPVRERDARADVRMERTYDALQLARRPGRIEQAILGADLLGVG